MRGKLPASVILVKTKEIYLHCAKAIMRAGLWDTSVQVNRRSLPTIGQMIVDQIGGNRPTKYHTSTLTQEYEKVPLTYSVIPANAEIQNEVGPWLPANAGMTNRAARYRPSSSGPASPQRPSDLRSCLRCCEAQ